jgi:hypothetical protein
MIRQVDLAAAAYPQRFHDRVAVARPRLEDREQEAVQVALQRFRPHK